MLATGSLAVAPSGASAAVILDGSFSEVLQKPNNPDYLLCLSGAGDECGTMQLAGLGGADWAYDFGPSFEPNGRCFDVDGNFTITLQSDGSTISGPLTGVYCPRQSPTAHEHRSRKSYGGPFVEYDSIAFAGGTGQFAGLDGAASVHTRAAGAVLKGTMTGTLGG
jgi:hypothetical protein